MKTRRTITTFSLTILLGGAAGVAFAVPDVAQDIARKTAQDAYNGNPYAAILLTAVFGIAGFLLAMNQVATIWSKIRGKGGATADPVVLLKLDSLDEKVGKIQARTDELWDDMNRRKGPEAGRQRMGQ